MRCPCLASRVCSVHRTRDCQETSCLHLVSLESCLSQRTVWCQYHKVDTAFIRKYFPSTSSLSLSPSLSPPLEDRSRPWLRGAAKLLETGGQQEEEGSSDWRGLAGWLGYNQHKVEQLELSLQPGLALLTDWFSSSSNTNLSLEMIIAGLDHLHRTDVIAVIREQEEEVEQPEVFISYQWDSQEEVLRVRQFLELRGLTCWMDIGQMGGGERLYQRIYQAQLRRPGSRDIKLMITVILWHRHKV